MPYNPINTAPLATDPCWISTAKGGWNKCLEIDKATGSVLPNCTGFCYGAWMRSTGITVCDLPTVNAANWYDRAVYYERGQEPKPGAIACWGGGVNGQGHVAFVNQVFEDGSITVAESGYYSRIRYQTKWIPAPYRREGLTFQGFIYNPAAETTRREILQGKGVSAWLGQAIITLGQRDSWKLGMISAAGPDPHTALQKIDQIDQDGILIFGSVNSNYFQARTDQANPYGEHYGTEISFTNDFSPHKGNVLAYAQLLTGETYAAPDSNFWYSPQEVKFACAPAAVFYQGGKRVNLWSTAFKETKASMTQQTMLVRADGRFLFAVCSGKLLVSQCIQWAEANFEDLQDLAFFDSGGSSQIMIGFDTPVYTGREIPNVLAFYEPKSADSGAVQPPAENEPSEPGEEPETGGNEGTEPGEEEDDMKNETGVPGMSNETFDRLRYAAEFLLPALAAFIIGMGELFNIPDAAKVAGVVTLVATFIGQTVIQARKKYNASNGGQENE